MLLHHLETHIGIVVLITNKPEAIDTAFQRRIRFSMTFPMPDAPHRCAGGGGGGGGARAPPRAGGTCGVHLAWGRSC